MSISILARFLGILLIWLLFLYNSVRLSAIEYGALYLPYLKYILTLSSFVAITIIVLRKSEHTYIDNREIFGFVIAILLLLSLSLQTTFIFDISDVHGRSAHEYLSLNTIYNAVWLLIGYAIQLNQNIEHKKNLSFILILSLTIIIYKATDGNIVVNYWNLRNKIDPSLAEDISHLIVGPAIYLFIIASYALAPNKFKIYLIPFAGYILFASGGRANLLIFIISVFVFESMRGYISRRVFIILLMFVASIIFVPIFLASFADTNSRLGRMLIVSGVTEDDSFQARVILFKKTIDTLPSQFLFGDVTQIVKVKESLGAYSHNILSVWEFYGFIVFILIIFFFLLNFRRVVRLSRYNDSPMSTFIVFIYLAAFIGVLTTKSTHFLLLWLSVGLLSSRSSKI